MKQTICFSALQSFPLEQQLNMIKRVQQQNAECNELDKAEIATINEIIANSNEGCGKDEKL